jgi:hypothetical protein
MESRATHWLKKDLELTAPTRIHASKTNNAIEQQHGKVGKSMARWPIDCIPSYVILQMASPNEARAGSLVVEEQPKPAAPPRQSTSASARMPFSGSFPISVPDTPGMPRPSQTLPYIAQKRRSRQFDQTPEPPHQALAPCCVRPALA